MRTSTTQERTIMSLPLMFNFRVLSNKPSAQQGGAFVEFVISSFAGSALDSGARFACEYHPEAADGAHWGVYPPEVRAENTFSLWRMILGPNPTEIQPGEPKARQQLICDALSNSLNLLMNEGGSLRAIHPSELASQMHNKIFVLTFSASPQPLAFTPTDISQEDFVATMASLSPLFAKGPRFHLEQVNDNPARASEIIDFKAAPSAVN